MRLNGKRLALGCLAVAALIYIYMSDMTYDFSKSAWSLPLSGTIFVIDPGHGGLDGGAVSQAGLIEKEVTLAISIYLRDFLQQSGALVLMTRETDRDLASDDAHRQGRRKVEDLKNRVKMINTSEADYLVSIHLNSIGSARWKGAQTFYNPQFSENYGLAYFVQEELIRNLGNTDRKAKQNQDVFILRHAEIPGILVEVGFLSNPGEAALLSSIDYQKQVAASIYQGILRYATGEKAP